jgi:methylisocitrate lyase
MEQKRVIELQECVSKLRAALAARGDAPFHVTARTDARATHGLEEAIRRAQAFADAGADAVFVEAPQSVQELREIAGALPGVTLVANMVERGKTPLLEVAQLAELGYRLIAFPVSGLLASAHAMQSAFGALARDGSTAAVGERLLGFHELNTLLGLDERYVREAQ